MGFLEFIAKSHEALWFFCTLIALTAVWFGLRYRNGCDKLTAQIGALKSSVEELPLTASRDELRAAVDRTVIAHTQLADRFKAWTTTLVKNRGGDSPRYFSSTKPAMVLDLDGFASEVINFRLVQSVPNILIGMGLLFTFLGLTAALMFASRGATAGDVTVAQQSLQGLLDAATFKFITSLVGLTCSILFGWFEKSRHNALERTLSTLLALLSDRYPYISAQQLLEEQTRTSSIKRAARLSMLESLDVLNSSFESPVGLALIRQDITRTREEAEEQTALLKTFNTDLAASISKAINESLTPQLTSTFDRLQDRIDHIGQQLNSTNAEALRSIITDFSSQFQSQAQQSFDQMMSAVERLTENIGTHSVRFERSFERVQEVVVALHEDGGRMLEGVRLTVDSLNTSVTRLEGLSELLQAAAEPLSRASESASSVMERVYDTQTAATEMVKRLEGVSEGFRGIDGDLTAAFTAMHSGFERLAADLRNFVVDLDANFSKALGGVRDVTDSLGSGVEGLADGLDGFGVNVKMLEAAADRIETTLRAHVLPADLPLNGSGPSSLVPN